MSNRSIRDVLASFFTAQPRVLEWGIVSLDESLGMYAWHCRHHTEHIRLVAGK
jgi:hypothetical protein